MDAHLTRRRILFDDPMLESNRGQRVFHIRITARKPAYGPFRKLRQFHFSFLADTLFQAEAMAVKQLPHGIRKDIISIEEH